MGLDIYFFKTKFKSNEPKANKLLNEFYQANAEEVSKVLDSYTKKLSSLELYSTKYNDTYKRMVNRLAGMVYWPEKYLSCIGYSKGRFGDCSVIPLSIETLKNHKDTIIKKCSPKYQVYFRKVWFINDFFKDKMQDDCFCFLTKEDIQNLLDYSIKVITKDKSIYEEDRTIQDAIEVRNEMRKFIKTLNDKSNVLVYFSY